MLTSRKGGRLFLAMAFYEGQSLQDSLAAGPLAIDRALAIAEQVARGLAEAHGRGITHRDIKPEQASGMGRAGQ